ncbi:CinA family nicotinamide mononucleotide deamidase-related protein [Leptospira sp. 96542]|nr:CinA family nicotinamide mononucleotide deamidase-related protein [Leptospira sp. 96542]
MEHPSIIIISTGSEITAGRSLDTNSGWIANELFELGWKVTKFLTLPDNPKLILEELSSLKEKAKTEVTLVLMTGGLGPTEDDYTLETVLKLQNKKSMIVEKARIRLQKVYESRGKSYADILPVVLRQIHVPEETFILNNAVGIAVGFIEILATNSYLVCMPGVPSEMKDMFSRRLVPELKRLFPRENLYQKTKWLWNIGESLFQKEFIETRSSLFQNGMEWGVTANRGYIKCIFQSRNLSELETIIQELETQYNSIISDDVFIDLHQTLKERKLSIAVAESCTGGLLGKKITDLPGSSEYFIGGYLTYSNVLKEKLLDVPNEILKTFGAVSRETAESMATNLTNKTNSDIGVSITGIAGPGGGEIDKPVGTVWIGISLKNGYVESHKFSFPGNREGIRENASNTAIYLVTKLLKEGNKL